MPGFDYDSNVIYHSVSQTAGRWKREFLRDTPESLRQLDTAPVKNFNHDPVSFSVEVSPKAPHRRRLFHQLMVAGAAFAASNPRDIRRLELRTWVPPSLALDPPRAATVFLLYNTQSENPCKVNLGHAVG